MDTIPNDVIQSLHMHKKEACNMYIMLKRAPCHIHPNELLEWFARLSVSIGCLLSIDECVPALRRLKGLVPETAGKSHVLTNRDSASCSSTALAQVSETVRSFFRRRRDIARLPLSNLARRSCFHPERAGFGTTKPCGLTQSEKRSYPVLSSDSFYMESYELCALLL